MLNVDMLSVDMPSVVMLNVSMLNVDMPSIVMLNVDMLNIIMLSVNMLNVVMPNVIMMNADMLSVVMLSAITPNVVAPPLKRWRSLETLFTYDFQNCFQLLTLLLSSPWACTIKNITDSIVTLCVCPS